MRFLKFVLIVGRAADISSLKRVLIVRGAADISSHKLVTMVGRAPARALPQTGQSPAPASDPGSSALAAARTS
jgi:hypothetical protein